MKKHKYIERPLYQFSRQGGTTRKHKGDTLYIAGVLYRLVSYRGNPDDLYCRAVWEKVEGKRAKR